MEQSEIEFSFKSYKNWLGEKAQRGQGLLTKPENLRPELTSAHITPDRVEDICYPSVPAIPDETGEFSEATGQLVCPVPYIMLKEGGRGGSCLKQGGSKNHPTAMLSLWTHVP